MGREVRRVPKDWQHPKNDLGRYIPLHDTGFAAAAKDWDENRAAWERGEFPDYADEESKRLPFDQWEGPRPLSSEYMPDWPKSERTHYQMYEDTTEGTPISPVMETPEQLAQWLVDNNASAFAGMTATYDQWLSVARGGFAPSAVIAGGKMMSGVEAMAKVK